MDHEIQVFCNDGIGEVRVIMINGEPWWVLKDICKILELSTPVRVAERLEEDEVSQTHLIDRLGREQKTTIISESGLYNVILRSDKQQAKPFRKWVTSEILPAIRKTGFYSLNDDALIQYIAPNADLQTLAYMRSALGTIHELNRQLEEAKPKVAFADQVAGCNTLIDMNAMAKLVAHNGFPIGRNRLFKWLRFKRVLMPSNIPYQEFIERGYFEIRESTYNAQGETRLAYKTLVTGKGQIYIVTRLRKEYLDDIIPSEV